MLKVYNFIVFFSKNHDFLEKSRFFMMIYDISF